MHDHVLQVGPHRLHIGRRLDAPSPIPPSSPFDPANWDLPRRSLVARDVVEELDALLEAVCVHLGPGTDRTPLLHSMTATLAIAGREACLPLAALGFTDRLRQELTRQAAAIGRQIASWAVATSKAGVAAGRHEGRALAAIALRSRCEGHQWTEDAAALLTGRRGGPVVMQLYNEWLHQLVLLRDSLLAFENWQEVPLPLHRKSEALGLRDIEPARATFLAAFLTRLPTHASIVSYARALFDPGAVPEDDIYGFQAEQGLALPCVVGRSDIERAPTGLLTWHAARLIPVAGSPPGRTVSFRYALTDYLSAPRSVIDNTSSTAPIGTAAAIVASPAPRNGAHLSLQFDRLDPAVRVDLGQSLRGHRFSYRAEPSTSHDIVPPPAAVRHAPAAVLRQEGLVVAEDGIHLLPTDSAALLTLALLGKIYPENTVLAEGAAWSSVMATGKGYGAKFVIGLPRQPQG